MSTRSQLLALAAASAVVVCLGTPVVAQTTIKIGELNSYKSQPAFLEPYRKGWELAVEEINAAGGINGIVGFRAGWGLGNALFIATSLAVIVASASGGFGGAIVLYEAALGIGIAIGPLLGGLLGSIGWQFPFFGVAGLMAIALVASAVFVAPTPRPAVSARRLTTSRRSRITPATWPSSPDNFSSTSRSPVSSSVARRI